MASPKVETRFTARDNFTNRVDRMSKASFRFGKNTDEAFKRASGSASRFGDILKGILAADVLKAGFSGIGGMIKGAFSGMVSETANVENAIADFKTLTGTMENSVKVVDDLRKLGAETPFEFGDLSTATKLLLGFEAATQENLVPTLKMLGDTAGGSADKLNGITLAFSQIQAAGKANMQDVNQLINNGVPILGQLAKQWGVNIGQARKMVEQGKATGAEITKAFQQMTAEGGKFYKGMETASQTLTGRWSTFTDNVKNSAANIGLTLLPTMKKFVDLAISATDKISAWTIANRALIESKVDIFIKSATEGFNILRIAVTGAYDIVNRFWPVIALLGTWFLTYKSILVGVSAAQSIIGFASMAKDAWKLFAALRATSGTMAILNAVMLANPVLLIAAGITAAIAAVVLLEKKFNLFSDAWTYWTDKFQALKEWLGFEGETTVTTEDGTTVSQDQSQQRDVPAPNRRSAAARARNDRFRGTLEIAGAPAGSTMTTEQGVSGFDVAMLGAN